MFRKVYRKFLLGYVLFGVVGFLLVFSLGYYIIYHENLFQFITDSHDNLLVVILICFLVVYSLSFVMLIFYHLIIHRPLQKITKGAAEFSSGNLKYKIPVQTEDEMGYLAETLNYMSDRLDQSGQYQRNFISNVSHDFRSPLTSIKGFVEAMLDGTIPVEMQEKYLKIIAYEAERLEKLTSNLLTLNEMDIQKRLLKKETFDINTLIRNTCAIFEGKLSAKKIHMDFSLTGDHLWVRGDMEQIQQVLYNLLDNAIKFSKNDSSIRFSTSLKNGRIFVSIKDFGAGIPKSNLPRIWDRFYKSDSSRGRDRSGTGLGLAIVKEIINAHEQHINVISTEGVGTEFIFTLEKAK